MCEQEYAICWSCRAFFASGSTAAIGMISDNAIMELSEQQHNLSRVWWIGGAPCAGKSTVAAILAERHGLALYRCDDALEAHVRRSEPVASSLLHALTATRWDALWMRPVATQIREELAFYREEFPLIVEDLCDRARGAPASPRGRPCSRNS